MDMTLSPVDAWENSLGYQASEQPLAGTSQLPSAGFPDTLQISPDQTYAVEANAVSDTDSSMASRFESWIGNVGDTTKTWSSDAGAFVLDEVKSGYGLVKSGLGTIADDVSKPLSGVLDFGITRIIVIVAVLGIVVYFIGKSGAVKVNAIV